MSGRMGWCDDGHHAQCRGRYTFRQRERVCSCPCHTRPALGRKTTKEKR